MTAAVEKQHMVMAAKELLKAEAMTDDNDLSRMKTFNRLAIALAPRLAHSILARHMHDSILSGHCPECGSMVFEKGMRETTICCIDCDSIFEIQAPYIVKKV